MHIFVIQISLWLNQNFLLVDEFDYKTAFSISFISLRNHQELYLETEMNGTTIVKTCDMDLAGDIVQSLSQFLHIDDLEVCIITLFMYLMMLFLKCSLLLD
jgi:Bardet-Biedl syndrome 2 protein